MQIVSSKYYLKRVPLKALAIFRILFGFLFCFQYYKLAKRLVFYKDPEYLYFPIPEFDWLPVLYYPLLWIVFSIGLASVFLLMLGFKLRITARIAAIAYFYLFVLDAVYFNNHYYLFVLLCFLLSFTDADKKYSISKIKLDHVPNWQYIILQLQLALVFFFGGVSKLSEDWLSGSVLEGISNSSILTNFLVYSGVFFDLLIPFFLFHYRTRRIALLLIVLFNLSNHFIFDDIASFPLLMIAALLLFFNEAEFPQSINQFFEIKNYNNLPTTSIRKPILIFLLAYFLLQVAAPLRHYFIPGQAEWTGQGHYFAWRMKSYKKDVTIRFYVMDMENKLRLYPINHGLNEMQIERSCAMPHMIPVFARQIKHKIEKLDGVNPKLGISVDYKVSLNGHKTQIAIDPDVDIAEVEFLEYGRNDWIVGGN